MAECPVCGAEVEAQDDMVKGELIECEECGTELEVKSVEPFSIAEAPLVEEDWSD
jgi:alpha-aminoadipate carrier protein LysW